MMNLSDHVVPGRHAGVRLVPGGGDVGVRPVEDDERLPSAVESPPLRVGAGEMAYQDTMLAALLEEQRKVGRDRDTITRGDERREAVLAHQLAQRGAVLYGESRRDIHRRGAPHHCPAGLLRPQRRALAASQSVPRQ